MGAREELAAVLAEHEIAYGCPDYWRCGCGFVSERTDGRTAINEHRAEAILASPALARLLDEARREALREVLNDWQWGEWTVLTPKVKHGGASAVVGGAQAVTDWLRARVDRIGGDGDA